MGLLITYIKEFWNQSDDGVKYGGVSVYDGEVESMESFSGFHVSCGPDEGKEIIGYQLAYVDGGSEDC